MKLSNHRIHHFRRQRGVVLFISLIVLVAMTLAGIALVRSVDTTNQIAGNLAFKQGATLAADAAIEAARTWLLPPNNTNTTLQNNLPGTLTPALCLDPTGNCYHASTPTTGPGTETPWPQYNWGGAAVALAPDAAGNQVSYVIHRLCNGVGPPAALSCINTAGTTAGTATPQGSSHAAGQPVIAGSIEYYYRVTIRITGPRNTVSYVQGIIQI